MDKIQKFLTRLSKKERRSIRGAVTLLVSGNSTRLDIKKLKGFRDVFRVRVGSIRIIYRQLETDVEILDISHRGEGTYKNL